MAALAVLSAHQARVLLAARERGDASCEVSLDLERTRASVPLQSEGAILPGDTSLTWDQVQQIADVKASDVVYPCHAVDKGETAAASEPVELHEIRVHSALTGRVYGLVVG